MKFLTLSLIFFAAFASQISAQSLLKDGKIPDDLLITVKKQAGWGGSYSEMTINAKGDFSSLFRGGLPALSRLSNVLSINGKPVK